MKIIINDCKYTEDRFCSRYILGIHIETTDRMDDEQVEEYLRDYPDYELVFESGDRLER